MNVSDHFTKGCFAIALPDTKSDTIAICFLNQYVALFGVPRVIVTDNASYFRSYTWTKFMTFLNVEHQFISAYHCQANGAAENFNRYEKTALRCYSNSENWFEHLGLAMLGINASYNQDIQMSRAHRLYGKTLRFPSSFFAKFTTINNFDEPLLLQKLMLFFEQSSPAPINTHKDYHKVSVDRKLFETPSVCIRFDRVKKGLEPSNTGPYLVLERFDKYFTIKTLRGQKNVSLDRLKSAYEVDILKDSVINSKGSKNPFAAESNSSDNYSTRTKRSNDVKSTIESTSSNATSTSESSSNSADLRTENTAPPTNVTTTRSGRVIRLPLRYAGVGKLFVRRATFEKNVAAEGRTLSLQNRKVYSLCKKTHISY